MIKNKKPTGRAVSMPAGLLYGALTSIATTAASIAAICTLIEAGKMPVMNIGYGIMITEVLAAIAGSIVAMHKIKRQKLAVCMLTGAIYIGILLSITALFFGGQYESVGITTACILTGSICAAFLSLLQESRRGGRKIKSPNR